MVKPRPFPAPPPWASRLFTIGVTGTNGKTTTTSLAAAALGAIARPVPRVTTLGQYMDEEASDGPSGHRGFLDVMRRALDRGGRFAAIEITSEVLAMGFAHAWPCTIGVFTNLTRDHLDAHGSAEHYLASKAQLFVSLPRGGAAVLNGCDPAGDLIAGVVPEGVRVLRYGAPSRGAASAPLDLEARAVAVDWGGTHVELRWGDAFRASLGDVALPEVLHVRALGEVFAENGMAALLAAVAAGAAPIAAAAAIAEAPAPRGRFEVVAHAPHVVVDYAHTPDALLRTVATARRLTAGRVAVVFGAGGNRDREKRPQMGDAARGADHVWITSDNPRDESPAAIAEAIGRGLQGHPGARVELDRARAIERAVEEADAGDVVVIAGKGHEGEQIGPAGQRRPFSDVDAAAAAHARRSR